MFLKKEISLPHHILYVVFLSSFTLSIGLGFFLFSFVPLLSYFNYPLIYDFALSPFFTIFYGSALACLLPPVFLIGTVRKYGFRERLMRMLEVQAFFFVLLVAIFSVFMYYVARLEDNMLAVLNLHYFSAATRILMCLYFYLSIKVSITSQDMPLPFSASSSSPAFPLSTLADQTPITQNIIQNKYEARYESKCGNIPDNNFVNAPTGSIENKLEGKFKNKLIKIMWEKHQAELPCALNRAFRFAQIIGFVLVGSLFFSIEGVGAPSFAMNYSFMSVFSLYFYLLYKMRERPYALWRPAYVCLSLYISGVYGLSEYGVWQMVFLVFFLCQCYICYIFYSKGRNWFVS